MKICNCSLPWAMLIGLICWGLGLSAQTPSTPGGNDRLQKIDVLRYDFNILLSDTSKSIAGLAKVKFKLLEATDLVIFDLVASSPGGKGMQVMTVKEEGKDVPFRQSGESLHLKWESPRSEGAEITVEILYAGTPADGLIISESEEDGRSFFGDNWPNRAHHWLPVIDHPTDKASVGFTVAAPAHYQIVANGKLVSQKVFPDGHQESQWENESPLPTKVMVIGAADFAIAPAGNVGDIPVTTWVFKKDEVAGFHDYAQGRDILEWFVKQVGPYPWDKLANVQSRTRYGGMENASCIFYADNSVTGDGSCEALMAHEIAHQWFGNSASEANWYDIWLSEGFATYWTHVYFEKVHGNEDFLKRMKEDRAVVLGWVLSQTYAVVDPSIGELNRLLNANSYQKGGWVLHMLRQQLGDDLFFKGIREYYARYKFGNATTTDFQKVMEGVSGQDLVQFFKQWLFTPGHPKLEVKWKWSKGKKAVSLDIAQTQNGDAFVFPLDLAFQDGDGKLIQETTVAIKGKQTKTTVVLDAMPTQVILDPHVKLLFEGKAGKK